MNLGLKETLPLLDFWESTQLLFRPVKTGAGKGPVNAGAGTKSASAAGGAEVNPRLTGRLAGSDRFETPSLDSDPAELYLFEDNEWTITVIEKGASAKLAHLTRTHRVNLHWMSEVVRSNNVHLGHIGTDDQAGDIFTKAFTDLIKWAILCSLVGVHANNILRSHRGSSPITPALVLCCAQITQTKAMPPTKNKKADKMDSLWLQSSQAGEDNLATDVPTWGRRSSSMHSGKHQTVATQANTGDPLATAVLREI